MSAAPRLFGALVAHDGVALVEYRTERNGLRLIEQWTDNTRSSSIDEALMRLSALVSALGVVHASLALALEQFGVFHHVMTLPVASDDVLVPVIRREVQRVFGVTDPVIAFTRGPSQERREPGRADKSTTPRQMFVAGAPRETIDALRYTFASKGVAIEIATVVPKAMHSLYETAGGSLEPTAVLVCLESGPHLAFFLEGRLELAIDPPIALEGDRPTVAQILDQVERGAVYFRQQFRGATPTRVLLAARPSEYPALAAALEENLRARVQPLFPGVESPEAVVAMGAVLEAQCPHPLDLYPHPPTLSDRFAAAVRGPNGVVAAGAAAALLAAFWATMQVASVSAARREGDKLRASISAAIPAVEPMRRIAQRRADATKQLEFVRNAGAERATLTRTLAALGTTVPDGLFFDTLQVVRSATGWNASLAGRSVGATAAQAVRAMDAFFQSLRSRPAIAAASLDQFDYAPTVVDSTKAVGTVAPVVIQFHLSFGMKRLEDGR